LAAIVHAKIVRTASVNLAPSPNRITDPRGAAALRVRFQAN
jgi:hypothetical protein